MNLEEFENEFLNTLINNKKRCIKLIDNNRKLIQEYYNVNNNSLAVKNFVNKLNNVILELKKFKVVDEILKHPAFKDILGEFRESDIFIRACQSNKNKDLVEWLFTKDIDPFIQDSEGKTALMHAAEHYQLQFAVEKFINTKDSGDHIHLTDINGNTALFYGLQNKDTLNKMLKANFDYRHINNDNENILLYSCKIDKYKSIDYLLELGIDANLVNNVGKTAAMYLVEHNRFVQLKNLITKKNIDVNFKNKFGETLVTTFIKSYYNSYTNFTGKFTTQGNYSQYKNAAATLHELVKLGCDFNVIIDDDGNTPIIFFLLTEDYISANYILSKCDIDLSITNKYDINASLLTEFLNKSVFDSLKYHKRRNNSKISFQSLKELLTENKTYDNSYSNSNNISMNKQYRYSPSVHTPIIQQWFLEVLYPSTGGDIKHFGQIANSNGSYILL